MLICILLSGQDINSNHNKRVCCAKVEAQAVNQVHNASKTWKVPSIPVKVPISRVQDTTLIFPSCRRSPGVRVDNCWWAIVAKILVFKNDCYGWREGKADKIWCQECKPIWGCTDKLVLYDGNRLLVNTKYIYISTTSGHLTYSRSENSTGCVIWIQTTYLFLCPTEINC